jgi:hypothetical protein
MAFGATQAYGCLRTSFSELERETRRGGAFSLYWDSNAFALQINAVALEEKNNMM